MKQIAIFALTAFVLAAAPSFAETGKPSPYRKTLTSVPAAELPAKAADLVKKAKARDWGTRTVAVIKDCAEINPAALPAVVGAISKAVPEMAAVAAEAAAVEQPHQAAASAKAAAAAAPSKAGRIVAAVCRAVPNDYRNIAVAVAEAAPASGKEVVNGVSSALPHLKPSLDQALSGQGSVPNVAVAMNQAGPATAAGPLPKGPTVGAPYVPLSGTPNNLTPASSQEVPTGGRDYGTP